MSVSPAFIFSVLKHDTEYNTGMERRVLLLHQMAFVCVCLCVLMSVSMCMSMCPNVRTVTLSSASITRPSNCCVWFFYLLSHTISFSSLFWFHFSPTSGCILLLFAIHHAPDCLWGEGERVERARNIRISAMRAPLRHVDVRSRDRGQQQPPHHRVSDPFNPHKTTPVLRLLLFISIHLQG